MRDVWIKFLNTIKTREFKILLLLFSISVLIKVVNTTLDIYKLKSWLNENVEEPPIATPAQNPQQS